MKPEERLIDPMKPGAWRRRMGGDAPVVVVTGTFDVLQPGNLYALRRARAEGGAVVVLLEPDEGVARHASPGRPQNPAAVRAEMVAHLRGVDGVMVAPPDLDAGFLDAFRPLVWVVAGTQRRSEIWAPALERAATFVREVEPLKDCFTEDILRALRGNQTPIRIPQQGLMTDPVSAPAASAAQGSGRVTVNGCFDILHIGHLRFLATARAMGGVLTVLINDDASVARYKGPTRPVFPEAFRKTALMALEAVDDVVAFAEDEPLAAMARLRPDLHVKGGSFEPERVRHERELLAQWGARVVGTPLVDGFSTSSYIATALKERG
ncbi:MAG: adenylyltransferase/cytidyltransferase family protein [bacterium]